MKAQTASHSADDARQKVWDLIDDIKFAMLVTRGVDGRLYARPMAAQEKGVDDLLWFFTAADTPKVMEIEDNPTVLLTYAKPEDQSYVSISGTARIVRDQAKIDELWSEPLKAWFPKGKDDPNVTLICVEPESAEYWDNPSSAFVQAFGYMKGKLTGRPENLGENRIVGLS